MRRAPETSPRPPPLRFPERIYSSDVDRCNTCGLGRAMAPNTTQSPLWTPQLSRNGPSRTHETRAQGARRDKPPVSPAASVRPPTSCERANHKSHRSCSSALPGPIIVYPSALLDSDMHPPHCINISKQAGKSGPVGPMTRIDERSGQMGVVCPKDSYDSSLILQCVYFFIQMHMPLEEYRILALAPLCTGQLRRRCSTKAHTTRTSASGSKICVATD